MEGTAPSPYIGKDVSNSMALSGLAAVALGQAPSTTALPMVIGRFAFGSIAVASWMRRGRLVMEMSRF